MSSLQFVVHPIPGTEDQLSDRLKEVADRLNRFGPVVPAAALSVIKSPVKKIVIGPNHFALLLEDGKICRIAFSIISERLDLTKNDNSKNSKGGGGGGGSRQVTRTRARIVRSTANIRYLDVFVFNSGLPQTGKLLKKNVINDNKGVISNAVKSISLILLNLSSIFINLVQLNF